MILAVSDFTTSKSKTNLTNYSVKRNVLSKGEHSEQHTDEFINSKQTTQISFTGNPTALLKGKGKLAKAGKNILVDAGLSVANKTKNLGEEASEAVGGAIRKAEVDKELPYVEKPIIAKLDGADKVADATLQRIIDNFSPQSPARIAIENFDPKCLAGTDTWGPETLKKANKLIADAIKENPSFKGLIKTSDIGDLASDVVGEGAIDAAKTAASEAGQYIAEEALGEAGYQAIERSIDAVLPGVGVAITALRWGNRGRKAVNLAKKAFDGATEIIYDAAAPIVNKKLDQMVEQEIEILNKSKKGKKMTKGEEKIEREILRGQARSKLMVNTIKDSRDMGLLNSIGKNFFSR